MNEVFYLCEFEGGLIFPPELPEYWQTPGSYYAASLDDLSISATYKGTTINCPLVKNDDFLTYEHPDFGTILFSVTKLDPPLKYVGDEEEYQGMVFEYEIGYVDLNDGETLLIKHGFMLEGVNVWDLHEHEK